MIRGIGTILSFVSALLFPWLVTALLAFVTALFEPLVPLAAGIFADTLYYTPSAGGLPFFTLGGAILTAAAFFVRSRLATSIIK